jgi:hypothetical protein
VVEARIHADEKVRRAEFLASPILRKSITLPKVERQRHGPEGNLR